MSLRNAARIATALIAMAAMGCGARTGLDLGSDRLEDADAGFDASITPFLCTYGRSGDPFPLGEPATLSSTPSLAWGQDRLGAAYRTDLAEGLGTLRFCRTPNDFDMTCTPSSLRIERTLGEVHLAFNGDEFGLCYTAAVDDEGDFSFASFVRLDLDGEVIGRPWDLDGDLASRCHGLAWNGDRWVALIERWDAPPGLVVQAIDREGVLQHPPLIDFGSRDLPESSVSLDATDDRVFAAAVAADGVHVRGLDRDGSPAHMILAGWMYQSVSVGIWDSQVGLLWSVIEPDGSSNVSFGLISGTPATLGPITTVAESGANRVELEPVWDGFVTARVTNGNTLLGEPDQVIATPMRFDDGGLMDPQADIIIAEGTFATFVRPSLSDDGHVTFVGSVFPDATGVHRAHLQLLSCHR